MRWLRSIIASLVEYGKHLKRSVCWPFKAATVSKEMTGSYDGAMVGYSILRIAIWSALVISLVMSVKIGIVLAALLVADFIHILAMAEISYHFKHGLAEFAKGYAKTWEQHCGNNAA